MQVARPASGTRTVVTVAGLTAIAGYVAILMVLMDRERFDLWGGWLLAPVLIGLSVPVLLRQARQEADPAVFRLLMAGLLVKFAGSLVRYYVAFSVYGGAADASRYHRWGEAISTRFRSGDFTTGLDGLTGTNFLRFLTGLVYTVTGPSKLAGFLVFSWLGFWGLYFFYRAFVIAVGAGRRRSYAHLLFFLPSLVFWPSSVGKEAWMMFALGVACYGVAKMLTGDMWKGLAPTILGLWLAGTVRPHVAALVGVSLAVAILTKKSNRELRELAPLARVLSFAVVGVIAAILVVKTDRFLHHSGFSVGSVSDTLADVQARTSKGGSSFVPSVLDSPVRAPLAALTVLFRPFVFEAHNVQAFLAALEGTVLAVICLFRWRWGVAAIRSLRRDPYVVFCLAYTVLFVIAFSSFANFGLLTRERVQLYPIFLVLISIPPAARRHTPRSQPVASSSATSVGG
jgi:hypothetical protein